MDDALWLDLVHEGYRPGLGVIWFYKADLDPAVTKTMPRGWRDLDYVVASPTVRRDAVDLPNVKGAMENSTPVATFGTGEDRIEIRRIEAAGGDERARPRRPATTPTRSRPEATDEQRPSPPPKNWATQRAR